MKNGLELVQAAGNPIVGLVNYGNNDGQVLVISDIGLTSG